MTKQLTLRDSIKRKCISPSYTSISEATKHLSNQIIKADLSFSVDRKALVVSSFSSLAKQLPSLLKQLKSQFPGKSIISLNTLSLHCDQFLIPSLITVSMEKLRELVKNLETDLPNAAQYYKELATFLYVSPIPSVQTLLGFFSKIEFISAGFFSPDSEVRSSCCEVWSELYKLQDCPSFLVRDDIWQFLSTQILTNTDVSCRAVLASGIELCSKTQISQDNNEPILTHQIQSFMNLFKRLVEDEVEVQQPIIRAFQNLIRLSQQIRNLILHPNYLCPLLDITPADQHSSNSTQKSRVLAILDGLSALPVQMETVTSLVGDVFAKILTPDLLQSDPLFLIGALEQFQAFVVNTKLSSPFFSTPQARNVVDFLISTTQDFLLMPTAFETLAAITSCHSSFVVSFNDHAIVRLGIDSLEAQNDPLSLHSIPLLVALLSNPTYDSVISQMGTTSDALARSLPTVFLFINDTTLAVSAILFALRTLPEKHKRNIMEGIQSHVLKLSTPTSSLCPGFEWLVDQTLRTNNEDVERNTFTGLLSMVGYAWFVECVGLSEPLRDFVIEPKLIFPSSFSFQRDLAAALVRSEHLSLIPSHVQAKLRERSQTIVGQTRAEAGVEVDKQVEQ
ncbi:hypothetical protein BLNAU_1841 [Blattamonas nauphoetae]|uniref:Uncharacterized protein n=1 Tax=Blattamonas nauphoetae TaxID=2049346 RepID=A0ABQ9YHR6_9EUKA|nr:hypothetical protein BLNAU_1841 [Blattamonas nauphoetae]